MNQLLANNDSKDNDLKCGDKYLIVIIMFICKTTEAL